MWFTRTWAAAPRRPRFTATAAIFSPFGLNVDGLGRAVGLRLGGLGFGAALGALEAVTAAAFGQRRKMLRASLKGLHQDAPAWLDEVGIDPERRPETLTVEEFCALARIYEARKAG